MKMNRVQHILHSAWKAKSEGLCYGNSSLTSQILQMCYRIEAPPCEERGRRGREQLLCLQPCCTDSTVLMCAKQGWSSGTGETPALGRPLHWGVPSKVCSGWVLGSACSAGPCDRAAVGSACSQLCARVRRDNTNPGLAV